MNPGEESFHWSSFDFNSSFRFYSSDDDNNIIDPDTYIEFELDSSIRKDFEFSVSAPKFVASLRSNSSPVNNGKFAIDEVVGSTSRGSTGNCSNLIFRLMRNVGPQRSPPKPVVDGFNNWELMRSRKASTTTNKISMWSSGILNRMRSIISLHPTPICNKNPHGRKVANWSKPIDNMFTKWRKYDLQRTIVKRSKECGEKSKSNGLVEDLKLTGVLANLFGRTRGRNSRVVGRIALSCPTSIIDSSPINQSGDAATPSVRAAIAHCKKSLGHADDFFF